MRVSSSLFMEDIMNKNFKGISVWLIVLTIQFIASAALVYFVVKLGLLPALYEAILAVVLVVLFIINFFFAKPVKKIGKHAKTPIRPLIGKIVSLLLSILLIVASSMVARGGNALSKITGQNVQTTTFQMIVLKDSKYQKIEDLKDKTIGVTPDVNAKKYEKAEAALKDKITFKTKSYTSFEELGKDFYAGKIDAIFIDSAYDTLLLEDHPSFESETRIIWSYEIKETTNQGTANKNITKEAFTVLISGVDSRGSVSSTSRSDVDMLVTVNPKTEQVLMTSIPRDYFVPLANSGKKDKLTHSGLFGTENVVKTIENFMNVQIDYYARVNFKSVEKIVDALGGIDVYSDKSYVPWTNKSIRIPKGNVHMNGKMALAFARERHAYNDGDAHRAQNQQDVLKAIISKMSSPSILTGYGKLLDAVEGCFQTNMQDSKIKDLVNMQLDKGIKWDFQTTILTGTGKLMTGGAMMPNRKLYYLIPNQQSITTNSNYIKQMKKDERINIKTKKLS